MADVQLDAAGVPLVGPDEDSGQRELRKDVATVDQVHVTRPEAARPAIVRVDADVEAEAEVLLDADDAVLRALRRLERGRRSS